MKVGHHEIAPGVQMSFDDERRVIIIDELKAPFPGFHAHWTETEIFASEVAWEESRFSSMVNEYYSQMVMWFWIDVMLQTI